MSTTSCTSAYAAHGCIGTAVSTHGSTLPMTGFDALLVLLVAAVVVVCGVTLRLGRR